MLLVLADINNKTASHALMNRPPKIIARLATSASRRSGTKNTDRRDTVGVRSGRKIRWTNWQNVQKDDERCQIFGNEHFCKFNCFFVSMLYLPARTSVRKSHVSMTSPSTSGNVQNWSAPAWDGRNLSNGKRFPQTVKFFDMATYGDRTLEKPSVTLYLLSLLAQRLRPPALGGGSPLVYWCLWCLLNTTSSRISLLLQLVPPSAEFLCQILSILNLFSLKRLTWLDSVCCFFM